MQINELELLLGCDTREHAHVQQFIRRLAFEDLLQGIAVHNLGGRTLCDNARVQRDARGGRRVVSGHHNHIDPRGVALFDGLLHALAWGVFHANKTK